MKLLVMIGTLIKGLIMTIKFYDVEHGSCCHIITPNQTHILVDVGSKTDSSIVQHINNRYFDGQGGAIGSLIITHPHEDHIYDLPNLVSILHPYTIVRPKDAFDIKPSMNTEPHITIAREANEINRTYNYPVPSDYNPINATVNGGVNITMIDPDPSWTNKEDLNTFSSVITMTYQGHKFVLTGDNPAPILRKMIRLNHQGIRDVIRNATVLLAPHHGRTKEFCQEFFDCVNPRLTIVSDKGIEHSTQEETARLYKGRGMSVDGKTRYVLTTRNDGTISFNFGLGVIFPHCSKEEY